MRAPVELRGPKTEIKLAGEPARGPPPGCSSTQVAAAVVLAFLELQNQLNFLQPARLAGAQNIGKTFKVRRAREALGPLPVRFEKEFRFLVLDNSFGLQQLRHRT